MFQVTICDQFLFIHIFKDQSGIKWNELFTSDDSVRGTRGHS